MQFQTKKAIGGSTQILDDEGVCIATFDSSTKGRNLYALLVVGIAAQDGYSLYDQDNQRIVIDLAAQYGR